MAHRARIPPHEPPDHEVGRRHSDVVPIRHPGIWGAIAGVAAIVFLLATNLTDTDPFVFALVTGAGLSWLAAGLLLWTAIVRTRVRLALKALLGLAFWLVRAGGVVVVIIGRS